MIGPEAALAGAALAGAVAGLVAAAVARTGPVDQVKARSSHDRPTATSGGLGLLAGAAAGLALMAWLAGGGLDWRPAAWVLGVAALLGLTGALDDLQDYGPLAKAAAHAAAAAAVTAAIGPVTWLPLWAGLGLPVGEVLGAAGSVLFLLVLMNAVNFMDGANGLAAGAAAIALAGLSAAGFLAGDPIAGGLALAGAGAAGGFLPWNLRGWVFLGDVGALFLAALIGGLGLRLAVAGDASPYLVAFTVLPLLTDVLLTLAVRARRRVPLAEAHREHLYQLWLQAAGRSHAALAGRVWTLTAACTLAGLALELFAPSWRALGLLAAVALLSAGWILTRRRLAAART